MSRPLRVLAALALVAAVALLAARLVLPRVLESAGMRDRIQLFARDALRRDVHYDGLAVGVLPPSLLVEAAVIAGASTDAAPFLRADRIRLRLALAPLFAGVAVVDALEIEGAEIHLERGPDGVALPGREPGGETDGKDESGTPGALAVRSVGVRGSRIVFADSVVSPPTTWDLRDVAGTLRGHALDEPLQLDVSGSLADAASLRVSGTVQIGGELALDATLDGVPVAPLGPYLGGAAALGGRVSGTAKVRGPAAAPTDVDLDLTLEDADVQLGELRLTGRVAVGAQLTGGTDAPTGPFRIDATTAELRYGGAYTKPVGTPAHVEGRVVRRDGRADLDYTLQIKNLDASGRLELGEPARLLASAASFELEGWGEMLPFLAQWSPAGPLALDDLDIRFAPLEIRGRAVLDGVSLSVAEARRVTLRGDVVGTGAEVATHGVELRAAGEVITVDGRLDLRDPRLGYRVRAQGSGLDADHVSTFFGGEPGFVQGPLAANADLTGAFASEAGALGALAGTLRLSIGRGRLGDASLLGLAVDRLGVFGITSALTGGLVGGDRTALRDSRFEELSATFALANGSARTDDFRLVSLSHTVELSGTIGLSDLGLDMTGRIVLGESLVRDLPGPWEKALGGVIPLASVRGTLTEPEVGLPQGFGPRLAQALTDPIGAAVEGTLEGGAAIGGAIRNVLKRRPRIGRREPPVDVQD